MHSKDDAYAAKIASSNNGGTHMCTMNLSMGVMANSHPPICGSKRQQHERKQQKISPYSCTTATNNNAQTYRKSGQEIQVEWGTDRYQKSNELRWPRYPVKGHRHAGQYLTKHNELANCCAVVTGTVRI